MTVQTPPRPPAAPAPSDAPPPGPARRRRRAPIVAAVLVVVGLAAAAGVVVATARHWTKVDVPEQAETFHEEEYETGSFVVELVAGSPCTSGQATSECVALLEAEYQAVCVAQPITPESGEVCETSREAWDWLLEMDMTGFVIDQVADQNHLTSTPEIATRQVSNEDYVPAVTHEAVCYAGFIGECT